MSIAVVIPSRTDRLINSLLDSLWQSDPGSVIVVDNGLSETTRARHIKRGGILFLPMPDPFCFAVAVNKGINAAPSTSDILLLNDDTVLITSAFRHLLEGLLVSPGSRDFGIISLRIEGGCGNPDQKNIVEGSRVYQTEKTVCFVAVLLRRIALDQVGLLDENFKGYGWDDDDLCWRMRDASWRRGVTGLVTVKHGSPEKSMSSTYHRIFTPEQQRKNSQYNRDVFKAKWGKLSDPAHYRI